MIEEPTATFLAPMGLQMHYHEGGTWAEVPAGEALRVPGTDRIRSSVLACWADVVAGGEANARIRDRIALTVDLTVRLVADPVADVVTIRGEVLKAGRATVFCEARMSREDGSVFAVSHMTFQSSPRPEDSLTGAPFSGFRRPHGAAGYPAPFFEYMGMRRPAPGVAELDRVPLVMNPAGTIQGGAVAAMVEAAAESEAGAVGDLELHYLRAVRTGPGVARATRLPGGPWRVEVRDPGNANRLCTLGLAWPAPQT